METYSASFNRRTRLGMSGRSVLGFAALAVALPFTSWLASAGDRDAATARKVSFQRQDLSDQDEVDHVYGQLRAAGHEVCSIYDGRSPESAKAHRQCVDEAVGEAVARIDAPLLTARYTADVDVSIDDTQAITKVASR